MPVQRPSFFSFERPKAALLRFSSFLHRSRLFAAVASCVLLAAAFAAGNARAALVRVTPDDDVAAIVEVAAAGDVIEFAPGLYRTHLTVRAAVVLRGPVVKDGADGTDAAIAAVIDAGGRGSGITVRVPGVLLEHMTVVNYGKNLYERDAGVRVTDGADGVTIRAMTLKGPGFGIRADRLEGLRVEDCSIEGVRRMHVLDRGDGVFLNYVKRPWLSGNRVRNVRDGFYFENVEKSLSTRNFFTGAQYGIHWMYTRGDFASDNVSAGVIGGFALMSSRDIHFEANTARKCVEFGVLLNVCDGCTVKGNRIEGVHNPRGRAALDNEGKALFIYGPGANRVERNSFSGADIGVGVALGGEGNVLTENSFADNKVQVRYVGRTPLEWSDKGRGNFWSTFMAWDFDGDGVADKPYQPNDSLDRIFWIYPEARFLMDSPVVVLLRWLSQQFEIDRGKGVTDSFPLMEPLPVTGARQ